MLAEIITIGDEILSGKTIDTNSSFIANTLMDLGIEPHFMLTISDSEQAIVKALDRALAQSDVVIFTGGLGPTHDDITKHTLSKYFKAPLYRDEELLGRLETYFKMRGRVLDDLNHTQADFPEDALKVYNDRGTATGMAFNYSGKWVFSLPGVPLEMKQMMLDGVKQILSSHLQLDAYLIKDIKTIGISEALLASALEDLNLNNKEDLKFAYLPKLGRVTLRIYYKSNVDLAIIDSILLDIKARVGDYIFDENGLDITEVVGELLKNNDKTLAVAESCTGGYLGHLITQIPGSSAFFEGGIISYSNEVKKEQLDIDAGLIESKGAVSEEVVAEMAKNVRHRLKTDYGIGISGIAGPDGGTTDKPVGMICFAIAKEDEVITKKYQFYKIRSMNIELSAITGLRLLWKYFLKDFQNES